MAGLVIVGASEQTIWAEWFIKSLDLYGYPKEIYLVNPRYERVLGRPCFASLEELPEKPDTAVIAIAAQKAVVECERLVAQGCKQIVVISNGFGETGTEEGREREGKLRKICEGHDVLLIGPNCVGFASFHDSLCAIGQPMPKGVVAGSTSVVSQSGGLTGGVLGALAHEGLGVDVCYSIGNGAVFGLAKALRSAFERPTTKMVCAIIEAVDDTAAVEGTMRSARAAGKELICLVLGQSQGGRDVALSHTGAVIGEQRMLRAWLQRAGGVLADSIADLGRVAAMTRSIGRPDPRKGVFVVTASGGGASLTADLASRHGVPLAKLEPTTSEAVRALLPQGAYIGNPLDVTAANGPGGVAAVYEALALDPNVGGFVEPYVLPWPDGSVAHRWHRDALERVAAIARSVDLPYIVSSVFEQPLSDWALKFGSSPRVSVTVGLEQTMSALGKLYGPAASSALGTHPVRGATARPSSGAEPSQLIAEADARVILSDAGLPVVLGAAVPDAAAAVRLSSKLRPPWALKLSLPTVGHKDRVGGVKLGLCSEDELRVACKEIARNASNAGVANEREVHFLLTEMEFGPELLVGAVRDHTAGPNLTIGVGGWAAEAGAIFGIVLLPIGEQQLGQALAGWGLPALLGERRTEGLVRCLCRLGNAFSAGPLSSYSTVEINPLILGPNGPVIVDALLVR